MKSVFTVSIAFAFVGLSACSDANRNVKAIIRKVSTQVNLEPGRIDTNICLGQEPTDENTDFLKVQQLKQKKEIEIQSESLDKTVIFNRQTACNLKEKDQYEVYLKDETNTVFVSNTCSDEVKKTFTENKTRRAEKEETIRSLKRLLIVAETVVLCGKIELPEGAALIAAKTLILKEAQLVLSNETERDGITVHAHNLKINGNNLISAGISPAPRKSKNVNNPGVIFNITSSVEKSDGAQLVLKTSVE